MRVNCTSYVTIDRKRYRCEGRHLRASFGHAVTLPSDAKDPKNRVVDVVAHWFDRESEPAKSYQVAISPIAERSRR